MDRNSQLSQAAQDAIDRILRSGLIWPGPDMLDAVLLKLELQEGLTVSEILLRRELRGLLSGTESREEIWRRLWM